MQIGNIQTEKTAQTNTNPQIQIDKRKTGQKVTIGRNKSGEYKSENIHRTNIGKYQSGNTSRKTTTQKIQIGRYKSEKYRSRNTNRTNTNHTNTHRKIQFGKY